MTGRRSGFVFPLLAAAVVIAGCQRSERTPTEVGLPPDATATFQRIELKIFLPKCAFPACHASPTFQNDLSLEFDAAYRSLVDIPSKQYPAALRVRPGDANASYLYWKVTGRQPVGVRMPLDQPPLSADDIKLIQNWINRGAPND